jgi:Zn-dependent protease with chaperone function
MAATSPSAGAPAPRAAEQVWGTTAAVDPTRLDDARLMDYRHPAERRTLLAIVGVMATIALILAIMGPDLRASLRETLHFVPRGLLGPLLEVLHPDRFIGVVALFLIGMGVLELVSDWFQRADILAEGVEMTATSFPQQYPVLEELRRRFAMPRTRVFVYRSAAKPYAFGIREPYGIVFPPLVLGQMTLEEFKFALGHEMGHIKLGHTRVAPLLGSGHLSGGGLTAAVAKVRNIITSSYLRAQELSCDRIGVLASRSVRPAIDRAIKQGISPPRGSKVDLAELSEQAAELTRGTAGLALRLKQLGQPQPDLVYRLLALTAWAGLPPPEPTKQPAAAPVAPAPKPAQAPATAQAAQAPATPPAAQGAATASAGPAGETAKQEGETQQSSTETGEQRREARGGQ